MTFAHSKLHLH